MDTQKVYTINDYWDGVLCGAANFNNLPHWYQRDFNEEKDDYEFFYRLSPMSNETLILVLEAWGIWCRWLDAYTNDKAFRKDHPALPNERLRYEELKTLLHTLCIIDESNFVRANGIFFEKDTNTGNRSIISSCSEKLVKWQVLN